MNDLLDSHSGLQMSREEDPIYYFRPMEFIVLALCPN